MWIFPATVSIAVCDQTHIFIHEFLDLRNFPKRISNGRLCFRKDIRLPVQLQRAMATEAEAAREARAKVIAAEGEMRASHSLKEASDVISTSPAALQVTSTCSYFVFRKSTLISNSSTGIII